MAVQVPAPQRAQDTIQPLSWWQANKPVYRDVLARLAADYPALFDRKDPAPLKIGIRDDLGRRYAEFFTPEHLDVFLTFWTRRREYRAAVAVGHTRHGLDGATTPLKDTHRQWAARFLPAAMRAPS